MVVVVTSRAVSVQGQAVTDTPEFDSFHRLYASRWVQDKRRGEAERLSRSSWG